MYKTPQEWPSEIQILALFTGGRHSTAVAFTLRTQPSRVWIWLLEKWTQTFFPRTCRSKLYGVSALGKVIKKHYWNLPTVGSCSTFIGDTFSETVLKACVRISPSMWPIGSVKFRSCRGVISGLKGHTMCRKRVAQKLQVVSNWWIGPRKIRREIIFVPGPVFLICAKRLKKIENRNSLEKRGASAQPVSRWASFYRKTKPVLNLF